MARRRLRLTLIGAVVLVLLAGAGAYAVWRYDHRGQAEYIPADREADVSAPWPRSTPPTTTPAAGEAPYLTSVSADGRYFTDQYGKPFLVRGVSPWSVLTQLSPQQMSGWVENRQRHGFNSAIVSLLGAVVNGAPHDDGTTYDGLAPFVDGDVTDWQPPYWQRAHDYLRLAADHGITVFLYPIDGWVVDHSFRPDSIEQCKTYGSMVAKEFADLPNLVWMTGGDYFPVTNEPEVGSDVDHCFDAMMAGVRSTGDRRPFSIQLGYQKSISTDNPYWAPRVDWNFVYTYYPTYTAVLEAYARTPVRPALMGEANYERENNQPETPATTDLTLRQQAMWALTSGAAGTFYGSDEWRFSSGWEDRLDTPATDQLQRLQDLIAAQRWWELVPDADHTLVTGGRGEQITDDRALDVLQSDYVTAAVTPDGAQAVIYSPSAHTFTVDRSRLADRVQAYWVDPASGEVRPVPMADRFTTPGTNAGGDQDWLLLLSTGTPPT